MPYLKGGKILADLKQKRKAMRVREEAAIEVLKKYLGTLEKVVSPLKFVYAQLLLAFETSLLVRSLMSHKKHLPFSVYVVTIRFRRTN